MLQRPYRRNINEHEIRTFVSDRDLSVLAEVEGGPCVSIVLPTHRAGSETRQDSIRFSNLVNRAEEILKEKDLDISILNPFKDKLNDREFWQHQGYGLAVFANLEELHFLRLGREVNEQVVVDDCYYLKPVVASVGQTGSFHLLALTWEQARLYQVQSGQWSLIENESLPTAYDKLMLPRDPEDQLQHQSSQAVGNSSSSNTAMFHGHGGGEDKIVGDRRNYLARVADLIEKEVYNFSIPFVLVSTEEVAGAFRGAVHFDVDATINESPANYSDSEMEHKFLDSAQEQVKVSVREQVAVFGNRFGTAMNQSLASDQIDEVIVAAMRGKIDSLMVNDRADIRGTVDRDNQSISIVEGNERTTDLVNRAVVEAIRTGAKIGAVSADRIPGRSKTVAAIFRF